MLYPDRPPAVPGGGTATATAAGDAAATRQISGDRGPIQAIMRAAQILELLSNRGALGIRSIGRTLQMDKTTVQRVLQTLEVAGFVARDPLDGKYSTSGHLLELGQRGIRHSHLVRRTLPHLEELHRRTGETVLLSTMAGSSLVYVARVPEQPPAQASEDIETPSRVGFRIPIHCTAAGKVFLAHLPEAERRRLYEQTGFPRVTPHSIPDAEQLEAELQQVRQQGWAESRGELRDGLWGVAAPLLDHRGQPIAAVALAVPFRRAGDQRRQDLGAIVRRVVSVISSEY